MKLGIFLAIALIGANVAISANSIPAHSYDLTVSFADTLGGPSLVPRGGTLVPGSGYGFGPNQGLDLGSGLANPANYSIRMIFKLDVISGYRKLLDIQNLSSDQGCRAPRKKFSLARCDTMRYRSIIPATASTAPLLSNSSS